jgi:hypothetical protein
LYEVTINHREGGPTDYKVYKKDEAIDDGIDFIYWKDANEGDWALTDDDYVAIIIKKKEYYTKKDNQKSCYYRTPFGYIMYNSKYPNTKFCAGGRVTNTTMSGKSWLEVRCGSEDYKDLALWAALTEDRDIAIDKVYGSVSASKRRKLRRHMRTEVFKSMKRDEAQKLLADNLMDADYFVNLMKDGIDMAKDKKDVNAIRGFVNDGMEIHGMKDKETVTTTDRIEAVQTKTLIDNINEEENKLIATRKIEKPVSDEEE